MQDLSTALGLCMCGQVVDIYSDIVFNFGVIGNIHDNVRVIRLRTARAQYGKRAIFKSIVTSSLSLMTDGTLYPGHPSH